ncbi:MAG: division/cell wall cluster transcriptional repressor MraZ [Actinomycetota bacterium]
MFVGTFTPRLDDKGRLILPAKFRDALAGGVTVVKGQEHCLALWPKAKFDEIANEIHGPETNVEMRRYRRLLMSGADDQRPDRQGRITVHPALRAYAGLDRDCTLIGVGPHLELWDSAAWQRYLETEEPAFAAFSSAPGGSPMSTG